MESSPTPIPYAGVPEARTGYGRGTGVWSTAGHHHVEDDWWVAFSLTPYVDYNMALLHGDTAVDAATGVLDLVTESGVPAVLMLAGAGLAASEVLRDAGWVCTGALPFMARDRGPADADPHFRQLGSDDLDEARRLAGRAFGVPDEVGAILFTEETLRREGTRLWGVYEGDELRCCSCSVWIGDEYSVGWGLSTAPEHQRAGYGRRLMRSSAARRLAGGPSIALLLATSAGRRLYEQEGYVTLEHWQIWSRRRWVLP
jgi:GNAT superfamily N-acetyltransferase